MYCKTSVTCHAIIADSELIAYDLKDCKLRPKAQVSPCRVLRIRRQVGHSLRS